MTFTLKTWRAQAGRKLEQVGIDFESPAGQTRPEKAQSLVAYCDPHNRMDELLARIRTLRPFVEWGEGKR